MFSFNVNVSSNISRIYYLLSLMLCFVSTKIATIVSEQIITNYSTTTRSNLPTEIPIKNDNEAIAKIKITI